MSFKEEFDISVSNSGKILTVRVFNLKSDITIFEKTIEVSDEKNIEQIIERLRFSMFEEELLYAMIYKYLIHLTSVNPEGKYPTEVLNIIYQKLSLMIEQGTVDYGQFQQI